jgi:hypothetical protein
MRRESSGGQEKNCDSSITGVSKETSHQINKVKQSHTISHVQLWNITCWELLDSCHFMLSTSALLFKTKRMQSITFHLSKSVISTATFLFLGSPALPNALLMLFSMPYTSFAALRTSSPKNISVPVATNARKMTSESV